MWSIPKWELFLKLRFKKEYPGSIFIVGCYCSISLLPEPDIRHHCSIYGKKWICLPLFLEIYIFSRYFFLGTVLVSNQFDFLHRRKLDILRDKIGMPNIWHIPNFKVQNGNSLLPMHKKIARFSLVWFFFIFIFIFPKLQSMLTDWWKPCNNLCIGTKEFPFCTFMIFITFVNVYVGSGSDNTAANFSPRTISLGPSVIVKSISFLLKTEIYLHIFVFFRYLYWLLYCNWMTFLYEFWFFFSDIMKWSWKS